MNPELRAEHWLSRVIVYIYQSSVGLSIYPQESQRRQFDLVDQENLR